MRSWTDSMPKSFFMGDPHPELIQAGIASFLGGGWEERKEETCLPAKTSRISP